MLPNHVEARRAVYAALTTPRTEPVPCPSYVLSGPELVGIDTDLTELAKTRTLDPLPLELASPEDRREFWTVTEPDGSKHGFRPRLTDAERRKNAEVLWKVALRERATARLLADAARSEAVAHDLALAAQDAALAAQDGPK